MRSIHWLVRQEHQGEEMILDSVGFSDELFFSLYYYSYEVLKIASEICRQPLEGALRSAAERFSDALGRCVGS